MIPDVGRCLPGAVGTEVVHLSAATHKRGAKRFSEVLPLAMRGSFRPTARVDRADERLTTGVRDFRCELFENAEVVFYDLDLLIRRQELSARKVGRSIRVEVASLEAVGKPLGVPRSQ